MISSDLLFQGDGIYIIFPANLTDILYSIGFILGVSLFFVFIFRKLTLSHKVISKKIQQILPQIDDIFFEQKIAQIIRNIIGDGILYPDAHTAQEIAHKKQHHLLPLLKHIEEGEYSGKIINVSERREILDQVRKEL